MKRINKLTWSGMVAFLLLMAAGTLYLSNDRKAGKPELQPGDEMPHFRAGDLDIGLLTVPETPRVGDNRLLLELRDEQGNPVSADIQAYAQMPAMGAMPAMRAPVSLEEVEPGQYQGIVNLSMRGEWPLTVQIRRPGAGERRLLFDLATDRKGLRAASGATRMGAGETGSDGADEITIDNRRRQMIGVKTGKAMHRDLVKRIRAVGEVDFDDRLLSEVSLKYDGFIGDLKADHVGAEIDQDQVLFTVYSPELLAAQREFLATRNRLGTRGPDSGLLRAARERLTLWDMSAQQIAALERRGSAEKYVAVRAPRSGTVTMLNISDGSAAPQGKTLLAVADLSKVWIEADVYEADLDLVKPGMPATVALAYAPGKTWTGTIDYIYPYLQRKTRTARIRLTVDNSDGALKPGMYAQVSLEAGLGHRLSVPEEAVIFAGDSRVVFVDLGGGRLKPVRIQTGRTAQGFIEVVDGLSQGDTVVTSGNFLIAAETRLKTGIEQW